MKLIDKYAASAKIEKIKEYTQTMSDNAIESKQYFDGMREGCDKILSIINSLEVKEVDLNEEIELVKGDYEQVDVAWNNDFDYIAKHFFELGLRSTITEEDCKLIWNIGDEIPNMPEEEFFKELLRRYKAQKGEEV
jgi:uncharacterized protein YbaR (Trm112 family)